MCAPPDAGGFMLTNEKGYLTIRPVDLLLRVNLLP